MLEMIGLQRKAPREGLEFSCSSLHEDSDPHESLNTSLSQTTTRRCSDYCESFSCLWRHWFQLPVFIQVSRVKVVVICLYTHDIVVGFLSKHVKLRIQKSETGTFISKLLRHTQIIKMNNWHISLSTAKSAYQVLQKHEIAFHVVRNILCLIKFAASCCKKHLASAKSAKGQVGAPERIDTDVLLCFTAGLHDVPEPSLTYIIPRWPAEMNLTLEPCQAPEWVTSEFHSITVYLQLHHISSLRPSSCSRGDQMSGLREHADRSGLMWNQCVSVWKLWLNT